MPPTLSRLLAAALLLPPLAARAQTDDFHPVLDHAEVLPRLVAPGGRLLVSFQFRNAGHTVTSQDCRVFLHFEDPVQGDARIVWQADHDPADPIGFWLPGETILDGPLTVTVPADVPAGVYKVHVGIFAPAGGPRQLDTDAGQVTVDPRAPVAAAPAGPQPLGADELAKRQAAALQLAQPVSVAGEGFGFAVEPGSGRWVLTDQAAGVSWTSDPLRARFGRVLLRREGRLLPLVLNALKPVAGPAGELTLDQPLTAPGGEATGLTFRLHARADARPPAGIELRYEVLGASPWSVERVWLLDGGLPVTEAGSGRDVLPIRLGLGMTPADGPPTVETRLTYDDSSMQMLSLEQQGAALLVTWDGVDVRWQVRRAWLDDRRLAGRRVLQHTLELSGPAHQITLHPVGKGDYVTAARAYREVAARAGWRVTRGERAKTHPEVTAMAGAADFKPFVFSRTVAGSRWNTTDHEQVHVGFTFAEAAQLAEHWHNDLGLDKAMEVLAGWINRGYDNRHPDILPAAPECGGNEALADAARRIKACGYLFGLHDNYQDMYADAPTFNDKYLRKNAAGKSEMGGNWGGGQAWQVRPQSQVELAQRNLPEVKRLFGPTAYFIDTVFAWGLVDSRDPADRWDRSVDLDYKSRLCALARSTMGAFGSEEGREWAVPVADYLEGQLGQKWDTPPGTVLPTFEIAYHDCVSTTTHQSTRLGADDGKHVLDYLIYGEMPVYNFGEHLYWTRHDAEPVPVTVRAEVKAAGPRAFDVTYRWLPSGPLGADYRAFVHFTHPGARRDEQIAFQDDHVLPATSGWTAGREVVDGPRHLDVPEGLTGDVELCIGLLDAAMNRQPLALGGGAGLRYRLGVLHLAADGLTFTPAAAGAAAARPFARPEGWARALCPTDRLIKNTYEVLSWVNRLSFGVPLESHEVHGAVERTRFGADLNVVVNYGPEPTELDAGPVLGRVRLGQYGFAVWSPGFVAVHALAAGGRTYATPALYTARSLDGQPLSESAKVRIYHGCGGPELGLAGRTFTVEREVEVGLR
jgi:hypothetical protein